MRRIALARLSLPTVLVVLCVLGLARMFTYPNPILAVERGDSIRGELRALRKEVQVVRRDVRRLIELLEGRVAPQDPLQPEDPFQHDEPPEAPRDSDLREDAAVVWDLTLREAIKIALDNSELFTSVSYGLTTDGPITIHRKDTDVTLTDAEDEAVKLVSDVEQAYWDLWQFHRTVDTSQAARDAALESWRAIHAQKEVFGLEAEAEARKRYFRIREKVERVLGEGYYTAGIRLRRLLGLAETDGRLIRPIDDPTLSKATFDWAQAFAEADNLPVLKRQRWQVRRAEMEAEAAAAYLRGGERECWQAQRVEDEAEAGGAPIAVPPGFRKALAGVRNAQLRLAKERAILEEAEISVSHELGAALRSLEMARVNVQTMHNRRLVSEQDISTLRNRFPDRKVSLDDIAHAKNLEMPKLLDEIEAIVNSGTKLNLDYYINEILDDDHQEEVFDYFREAETESVNEALDELGEDEYSEEDIRLMRIKFMAELRH